MKVLITGASGFIAKNLIVHLKETKKAEVLTYSKNEDMSVLNEKISLADFIFHLAGVNRPQVESEFDEGNVNFTEEVCKAARKTGRKIPILFSSSIQASLDNAYGKSKLQAENILEQYAKETGSLIHILRLPNVFGKWCRPNYNSVVATFCHNIAKDLPIQISNEQTILKLVYIDDVIDLFMCKLDQQSADKNLKQYEITLGELAEMLYRFKESRSNLLVERVGTGLTRALYSTYITYFRPENFSYSLKKYEDPRGVFCEMLKTYDSGQCSFFTAHPGVTRGGHYHHSKNEKFLVVKGEAKYKFCHIVTNETFEILSSGDNPLVVETIPGWSHDITNIGEHEMIVLLWANEIFDREHPDTISFKV